MKKPQTLLIQLSDRQEAIEQTINLGDLARADIIISRLGLPKMDDSRLLYMCVTSFAALTRTKQIDPNTVFETFLNNVEAVEPKEEPGIDEDAEADKR